MDVTKPYKSIGFGARDVTKPYKSIGFGTMDVTKPYKSIGFGASDNKCWPALSDGRTGGGAFGRFLMVLVVFASFDRFPMILVV